MAFSFLLGVVGQEGKHKFTCANHCTIGLRVQECKINRIFDPRARTALLFECCTELLRPTANYDLVWPPSILLKQLADAATDRLLRTRQNAFGNLKKRRKDVITFVFFELKMTLLLVEEVPRSATLLHTWIVLFFFLRAFFVFCFTSLLILTPPRLFRPFGPNSFMFS